MSARIFCCLGDLARSVRERAGGRTCRCRGSVAGQKPPVRSDIPLDYSGLLECVDLHREACTAGSGLRCAELARFEPSFQQPFGFARPFRFCFVTVRMVHAGLKVRTLPINELDTMKIRGWPSQSSR